MLQIEEHVYYIATSQLKSAFISIAEMGEQAGNRTH